MIASAIEGIKAFDKSKNTCLQTDWCREGIGYLLLQQHCSCTSDKIPLCCKDGWKLVMAGSRFTKGAEVRYSPTEGEALGVAWSLEHARMFVLGCEKLVVSTDHKPLLGLFQNRSLSSISNPRLLKLKQRTLAFHFRTKYNPGKWHRGPDALSRHPTISPVHALFCEDDNATPTNPSKTTDVIEEARLETLLDTSDLNMIELERAAAEDSSYRSLLTNVISGFPKTKDLLDPSLNSFWNVKDRLSFSGNLVFLEDRIVIPRKYQSTILNNLHAAHQGVSGMLRRASQSFYWPNLETAIRNKRYSCKHCNERSPSQQKESYCPSPPPKYPFQEICLDYFQEGHHHYLSCVDRFSGWIIIFHFIQQASARKLVDKCRDIFTCYGVAETINSDGGPQFTSDEFKTFLENWGIHHRVSSVDYPQSNGRAELGVKAARRIIMNNTNSDGSLSNDKAAQAILQYRNTPIPDIWLSPAQILLHRQLRDGIPTHPTLLRPHKEWVISAEERERAYAHRDKKIQKQYNEHAKDLKPMKIQTPVILQEKGKWQKTGRVVECLPNRQYRIRMDGSGRITLRNRKYLKEIINTPTVIPSPMIPQQPAVVDSPHQPEVLEPDNSNDDIPVPDNRPTDHIPDPDVPLKKPRHLIEIQDFNRRGLEEDTRRPASRLRGGKDY